MLWCRKAKSQFGYMNYRVCHYIFYLLFFTFVSCKENRQIKKIVEEMQGKEIIFPKELKALCPESEVLLRENNEPCLIIYFSKLMCTVCNIDKIKDWDNIKEQFKKWKIIYVFSFNDAEETEIVKALHEYYTSDYAIYLDRGCEFERLNPVLGECPILHVFLIDSTNHIKIVGDPLYNKKMLKVYEDYYIKTQK